jgi:hypothetical protein
MSFGERKLDRTKPEIDFPEGEAPTELVVTDLVEGTGAEATAGKQISCHYVGVTFSAGEEFDASWNRGQPLDFTVGIGQVIEGWDQGRGQTVAFIEVKARPDMDQALIAITEQKRRRIARAAKAWLRQNRWAATYALRGDAVFIAPRRLPRHLPGAFELDLMGY